MNEKKPSEKPMGTPPEIKEPYKSPEPIPGQWPENKPNQPPEVQEPEIKPEKVPKQIPDLPKKRPDEF